MPGSLFANPETRPQLDESLYPIQSEKDLELLRFLQTQIGIQDEEELKQHVLRVQAKAYNVYGYPCIRGFSFLRPKVLKLPGYRDALDILRKKPDAVYLDMGCCFGTDLRKAVTDGWPVENIIGSDLQKGFWDCGHELFNSSSETFPAAFIQGDVLDSSLIQLASPVYPGSEQQNSRPKDLRALTSLTPLQGHVSVIHASSFFHLFKEDGQLEAARQLASLLSPESGSVIFGSHVGLVTKGRRESLMHKQNYYMFCHSPESWKSEVWDGPVFERGNVEVKATLRDVERQNFWDKESGDTVTIQLLVWSVKRL